MQEENLAQRTIEQLDLSRRISSLAWELGKDIMVFATTTTVRFAQAQAVRNDRACYWKVVLLSL
jgi:hypothetical protein